MLSGRRALRDLDKNLGSVRTRLQRLSGELDRARVKLMAIKNSEGDAYKQLASLRVKEIAADSMVAGLDRAERHVRDLLNSRETAVHDLGRRIRASEETQVNLEDTRNQVAEQLAQAAEALDEQQAKTQAALENDESYQEQLWQVEKADSLAKHAEEKTRQSEEDQEQKGKPYRDDELFMYLWEKGFGTSRYRAWPLTRFLDGRVAKMIRYENARVNYSMLTEIPKRLQEHADGLRHLVSQETEKLVALEEQAAARDGIPELDEKVEAYEQTLAEADAAIEAEELNYAELLQEQGKFDRGEDPYFGRAVDVLVEELKEDSLSKLRRDAERTDTPRDDDIVSTLRSYDQERDDLQDFLRDEEGNRRALESKLHELESLRRRFKSHRYDAVNSEFPNDRNFGDSLGGFIGGILSSEEFWRAVTRGQRFRRPKSRTVFGSGGFGRPRRRRSSSVWKNSGWGGRGGGGRGGGGGFSTGGGF